MRKIKYIRFGIVFLVPLMFIFSQCFHKSKPADPRGPAYAGSASCLKCHKNVEQDYLHSAHYLTSRPTTLGTILGSFSPGSNTVLFNNGTKAVMEQHKNGYYQAAYTNGKLIQMQRLDITFGSKRGQTFLYWKGNSVYQLPITYYINLHTWANSPGYSADSVEFSRVISARCFECHASNIQPVANQGGAAGNGGLLDKTSLILGIDCERCHGPAAQHVSFHTENPQEKQPHYIVKISTLSRAQRMDLCSVCHSGNSSVMIKSTFEFKPGDTLANFNSGDRFHRAQEAAAIDVHGNQAKLLTSSQCFIKGKIECTTCHSIHDTRVKSISMYSEICTTCHGQAKHNFCKMENKLGSSITSNCIDCHMPVKTSNTIVIYGPNKQKTTPFVARLHRIAIYPEESKKIIAMFPGVKKGG